MHKLSVKEKLILVKERLHSLDRTLSEEQLDFVLHPISEACYLKACPGSGKTEVVGIKAAYEIVKWNSKFTGIAVLSFTKNAAKEIADRIKKFGGTNSTQHPHFIGTIDSWLHNYILHPFGHKVIGYEGKNFDKSYRLVDNEDRYDFLTPFQTVISQGKFAHINQYYFDCEDPSNLQSQSRKLNLKSVKPDIKKNLQTNKKRFFKAGMTTYADAEFICYHLLKKNKPILENVVKRFPIILIDECQDLSNNQLGILNLLIQNGTIIHFVGDNNQSIYEFKNVHVENINAFIADNNLVEKSLTRNFRSNQKIVNVSTRLEQYNTGTSPIHINGNEDEITEESCILWEYTSEELPKLPQKFIDHINQINSTNENTKSKIKVSKSGVLARAHTTLSAFRSHPSSDLSKIELFANALNCWDNNPRTGKDMQNALQQIGKSISMLAYNGRGNHQYQYCPEFYNQIEWRNQLSDLVMKVTHPIVGVFPFSNLTWSQWVAKLKVFLEGYWTNLRTPINDWNSVKTKIRSPNGKASKLVLNTMKKSQTVYSEKIRMTTFHDIKGETLDAVLIVSSTSGHSQGGYYEHWLTNDVKKKEHVRFAYVASSRPKHLLIWAIPKKTNNTFIDRILELGFTKK